MFRNNPLYSYSPLDVQNLVNDYKTKYTSMNDFIDQLKLDRLNRETIKSVYEFSHQKLEYLIPEELTNESILTVIFLFLCNSNRPDIQKEKSSLVKSLIFHHRKDEKQDFDSGKFSMLLINLIKFFEFLLVYFFLCQILLSLNRLDLERLLLEKEIVNDLDPHKVDKYILSALQELNKDVAPDSVDQICLPFIFEPIKKSSFALSRYNRESGLQKC